MQNLLITGGAGFIGSNFVRLMLDKYPDYRLVVFDKLTYAGNLDNLRDLLRTPALLPSSRATSATRPAGRGDAPQHTIDTIVNFAAETHVDRSIQEPGSFIQTDVYGTYVLLEATRELGPRAHLAGLHRRGLRQRPERLLAGDRQLRPAQPLLGQQGRRRTDVPRLLRDLSAPPVLITRGSNNYGPYQYPEKLIPLFITNAIDDKPLPVYGDGLQVRDWIYVLDHCEGIDAVLHHGALGEAYNVGGGNEQHQHRDHLPDPRPAGARRAR